MRTAGRPTAEALSKALPDFIAGLRFDKSMRWNASGVAFSRPLRWIVALLGDAVIPCDFAGVVSGRSTRGLRPYGSPEITLSAAADYARVCAKQGIALDMSQRRETIRAQVNALAAEVGGHAPDDQDLLDEVTNLVEAPTAFRGTFDSAFLDLPRDVLVTVMRKHQRYFAVEDADGALLPCFIGVRNGDSQRLDKVIHGNEQVIPRPLFGRALFLPVGYRQAAGAAHAAPGYPDISGGSGLYAPEERPRGGIRGGIGRAAAAERVQH